ncbi:MAG TPA: GNAT family N-acetyltransferase [Kofleriaceae bacterium]|nr:GNAT family N-acetyltransferase [Kofleriaceae bacterium]
MSFTVRALHKNRDRQGVEAVDTAFETASVFDVVTRARQIELVERTLAQPLVKRYDIDEVYAPWARWKQGWVAEAADEAGGPPIIRGFATAEYEAWHSRMILWFFYVSPAWRRRGLGRALIAEVEAAGRAAGADHVWIETSSVNVPGVVAYERLGYGLVGADRLFYGKYMPGEQAIYLAKML